MRKSKSSNRAWIVRAGLTAGVVGAALLVAPQAAWAAGSTIPFTVPALTATTVSVVDPTPSGTGTAFTNTSVAQIRTDNSACGATWAAPAGNVLAGTGSTAFVSTTRMTVGLPNTLTTGTNGVPKLHNLCIYADDSTTASVGFLQSSSMLAVGPAPTLSTPAGASGGGNPLTVTTATNAAAFTGVTTLGAFFVAGNCPATYGTPTANLVAADANRLSNTSATLTVPAGVVQTANTTVPTAYNICFYNGNVAASTLVSTAAYTAGVATLNPVSGPTGGGNGVTVNTTTNLFAGLDSVGVVFTSAASCPTNFTTTANASVTVPVSPTNPDNVRKLADNRIAVTVPTAVTAVGEYKICMYDSITAGAGAVVASAIYTVAAPITLNAITPAAGPATGGTAITVAGSGFPGPNDPGTISATLGGVSLLNIQKLSGNAFTAVTPRHSADNNATLVVVTAAGTRVLQNAFAFQNSLSVRPNTAPNTLPAVNVEVTGSGFLSYSFGGSALNRPRVFLVDGVYNPAAVAGGGRANGPVADCTGVLVVSDETLICTLRLDRRLDAAADPALFNSVTYTNNSLVVGFVAGSPVINVVSGGTFSPNDVGQRINEDSAGVTNIPASGVTITQVLSPTRAVISTNSGATTASQAVDIGAAAAKTITAGSPGVSFATGSRTLVAGATTGAPVAGTFSSADIGRVVSGGTNIVSGSTIVAVAPNGSTATLSAPAGTGQDDQTVTLFPAASVPNGAYTLTVVNNGAVNAATTDPNYEQSAITSGATFTVAPA